MRGEDMTAAELTSIEPGTRILTADAFTDGEDDDLKPWLGKVVTLRSFDGFRWVYCEEMPDNPFNIREIIGVCTESIDDESVEYETGDLTLIFGEVVS